MKSILKDSKIVVRSGKGFSLKKMQTDYTPDLLNKKDADKQLAEWIKEISKLQNILYASDNHSILMIFQARDAAGKDSTIKHVMSGINPTGCQVVSFKTPSAKELDHDFLWRTTKELPEQGNIGIFNRSYYEEVIVTKVHPEFILGQKLPGINSPKDITKDFWEKRYQSIRDFEKHLINNGVVVLKFFLNVSKEEQKNRFLERIDNPEKHWKFSYNDITERRFWKQYDDAFEKAIKETSTDDAPWFILPADKKWSMQLIVSKILLETLQSLKLEYPKLSKEQADLLKKAKEDRLNEN